MTDSVPHERTPQQVEPGPAPAGVATAAASDAVAGSVSGDACAADSGTGPDRRDAAADEGMRRPTGAETARGDGGSDAVGSATAAALDNVQARLNRTILTEVTSTEEHSLRRVHRPDLPAERARNAFLVRRREHVKVVVTAGARQAKSQQACSDTAV